MEVVSGSAAIMLKKTRSSERAGIILHHFLLQHPMLIFDRAAILVEIIIL
jgi:hypothetical protein